MMAIIATFLVFNAAAQSVAKFDDLTLAPEKFWNGSDLSGSFKSEGITFYNTYTKSTYGDYWSGFVYSNITDVTTAGYTNQYSSITGKGYDGSANYAVCYPSPPAEIEFKASTKTTGFYVTNSTYAYLSMKNGDTYAKKFGGASGNDPDYFQLMIEAVDTKGLPVDTVDFYLADFRFADNSKDYILNQWTWVDLSSLKEAKKLRFSLSSSDNSFGFMNTPGYFCMDNLSIQITSQVSQIQQLHANVFPNPFTDRITISGIQNKAQVSVLDISGRTVAKFDDVHNNQEFSNLSSLKSGIYFLKISENGKNFTTKLVKR